MDLSFVQFTPGVASGSSAPEGWLPISARPLLVLVGVTGVGKSSALAALDRTWLRFHVLPDRRELTDRVIIGGLQREAGQRVAPVTDRLRRFEYTRAYRERYPGGMAHALANLWINPMTLPGLLLFDGLRGENEVTHAARLLPFARFAVLDAPDVVRVARLMGRSDPFDQVGGQPVTDPQLDALRSFADLQAGEASELFTPAEEQALLELVRSGAVTAAALRASLAIVVEERRNYAPAETQAALLALAPDRTRVVDTVRYSPLEAAAAIVELQSRVL